MQTKTILIILITSMQHRIFITLIEIYFSTIVDKKLMASSYVNEFK